VEQELLTLPEHLSSPLVFSGVRVTPYIEEEQKTQWPKENGQKDKQ
jgi:hypothetical protein